MKLNIDGVVHDLPHGIDVNVWDSGLYGSRGYDGIVISVYRMSVDADGFNITDTTHGSILSINTDLPQDEWGEDDWFGLSDDTAPGDFPAKIYALLLPYIAN